MNTEITPKGWWDSKVAQGAIVALVAAIYRILARHFHWPEWNSDGADLVTQLLTALGIAWAAWGLRTATRPIGNPNVPVVTPATPAGTASGEVPVATIEPLHDSTGQVIGTTQALTPPDDRTITGGLK